jgi:hypothetical protein
MFARYALFGAMAAFSPVGALAQCSLSAATSCLCREPGATTCDLLPDLTISWTALESYLSGPSEYSQTASSNQGRLRVSGSTPNIGFGPLEVRTADMNNLRHFVCGTDTFTVSGQTGFSCPNGQEPKQIIFQQIYRKQGNQMTRSERMAGSMTYHSAHSHYHVNDWTTMNLAIRDLDEPDPRKWPVVATGAKIGFCLMDYGACSSYQNHCRTTQEYQTGTPLNSNSNFPNYGLYGNYGCGTNVQGISVGRTDIYSKNLDMMWINLMHRLCNGDYWIVAEVDPTNVFREENEDNNFTMIPFTLTQQRPGGSGGVASILSDAGTTLVSGSSLKLTATPGYSYTWSNGASTRSIDIDQPGTYTVTVTAPCGSINASITIDGVARHAAPQAVGSSVLGPSTAQVSASGEGAEIVWYAGPSGGDPLAVGAVFTTPELSSSTTYYAATRTVTGGDTSYGAKTNRSSGSLNSTNGNQWLLFDADQPFDLVSVKVYATGNGERHFVLMDDVGNVIAERYVYVPAGTQRVQLNMRVPKGTGHRITAFDDNTEIIQALHRDNSGVSYPYPIGAGLGTITGSTSGASQYWYLYDWEVRSLPVVNESERTAVVVEVTDGVRVDAKVFLQGPYDAQSGLMNDGLRTAGLIPSAEPFTALGFTHVGGGGEVAAPGLFNAAGPNSVVDWVLVELRSATDPAQVLRTASALLRRNGTVVGPDGAPLRIPVPNGSYHVAIRHRNHLGAMTAFPVSLTTIPVLVDLSDPATPTLGSEARNVIGAVAVLWAGNAVRDNKIIYTGAANDRDPILVAIGGITPTATVPGYHPEDLNMDGLVKYTGINNDRDIVLATIGGVVPTAARFEQLP